MLEYKHATWRDFYHGYDIGEHKLVDVHCQVCLKLNFYALPCVLRTNETYYTLDSRKCRRKFDFIFRKLCKQRK